MNDSIKDILNSNRKKKKVTLSVTIDNYLNKKLKEIATQYGATKSEVVNIILSVSEILKQEEK